jgi:ABC-type multidrug transport system fused ATPase/permease subunit
MVVGARTIKSYGWENHFLTKIISARKGQTMKIFWFGIMNQLGFAVFSNFGLLALMIIFLKTWYQEIELDESVSISLMAMIFFLFYSVNIMTYMGLTTLQTFLGILERISSVIQLESYEFKREFDVKPEDVIVKFDNVDVSWGFKVKDDQAKASEQRGPIELEKAEKPVVTGIDMTMKRGDFLCIIGQVGCGKTTVLNSVMQETVIEKGTSKIAGSIAYVEQEPFIFGGTVEQNITFGRPYNKEKMDTAIKVAQLSRDVEIFGKGLKTMIGERGINVSGG